MWFIEGFDLAEHKRRINPVDDLTEVKICTDCMRISRKKILELLRKQEEAVNLVLELGPKVIAQYKKYHSIGFSISYINPFQTKAILRSYVKASGRCSP